MRRMQSHGLQRTVTHQHSMICTRALTLCRTVGSMFCTLKAQCSSAHSLLEKTNGMSMNMQSATILMEELSFPTALNSSKPRTSSRETVGNHSARTANLYARQWTTPVRSACASSTLILWSVGVAFLACLLNRRGRCPTNSTAGSSTGQNTRTDQICAAFFTTE